MKLSIALFRLGRLVIHLNSGMMLAVIYPYLSDSLKHRILKTWSRQLLAILNITIRTDGPKLPRNRGCLIVANHVSWLDMFVLNAIHPVRFIAKSEVSGWPIVGWLSRRSGTLFISRSLRQDANAVSLRVGTLLKRGSSIGLFPEGTTTDGRSVRPFHSALFQPAVDAGISVCPIALRYEDEGGAKNPSAEFIGDTTLVQSIWRILFCPRLVARTILTPELPASGIDRRTLSRTAQDVIATELKQLNHDSPLDEPVSATELEEMNDSHQSAKTLPQAAT